MELKISDSIGFCFGVKRAIKLAKAELKEKKKVTSIGPIIHNPQVVRELAVEGLGMVDSLSSIKEGFFLIPSHGVGPSVLKEAKKRGLDFVDTTCPFVKKSQALVSSFKKGGYKVLIIGDGAHAEIMALVDCAGGDAEVIGSEEDALKLDLNGKKVGVVAQTTQSQERFLKIVSILQDKDCKELKVANTICQETVKRQRTTRQLAEKVDVMLIVGGRNSANTSRLVNICQDLGKQVYHIEAKFELKPEYFIGKQYIGISSGASTPDWIIEEVLDWIKHIHAEHACERGS